MEDENFDINDDMKVDSNAGEDMDFEENNTNPSGDEPGGDSEAGQQTSEDEPADTEDNDPENYFEYLKNKKGIKDPEQLAKMYYNLEKKTGAQKKEIGDQRKELLETMLGTASGPDTNQSNPENVPDLNPAVAPHRQVDLQGLTERFHADFMANPVQTLLSIIDARMDNKIQPFQKEIYAGKAENILNSMQRKYPDFMKSADDIKKIITDNPDLMNLSNGLEIAYQLSKYNQLPDIAKRAAKSGQDMQAQLDNQKRNAYVETGKGKGKSLDNTEPDKIDKVFSMNSEDANEF